MKRREFLTICGGGMMALLLSGCSSESAQADNSKINKKIPDKPTPADPVTQTNSSFLNINFAALKDGLIPDFFGSTWSVLSGQAVNLPALGGDLLVNGDMELNGNPLLPGWSPMGGAVASQVADERPGGTGSNSANVVKGSSDNSLVQEIAPRTVGAWYLAVAWVKNISLTGGVNFTQYDGSASWAVENDTSASVWNEKVIAVRYVGGQNNQVALLTYGNAGEEARLDDVTLSEETSSSLFAVKEFSSASGWISAQWTGFPNSSCPYGVVMCADYPNFKNFVIVYYDNHGSLHLDKCVDGVYTNLMTAAVSYNASSNIILRRMPGANQFQAWYGLPGWEAPVGEEQMIDDAGIINNVYHGLFDTSPKANTCSRFVYSSDPTIGSLAASSLTVDSDSVWHGYFRVLNNVWNKSSVGSLPYSQSIQINESLDPSQVSAAFQWSWPLASGQVKSYPEIIYGYAPWLGSSSNPHLPQKLSDLGSYVATFDTEVSTTPDAMYNTSFDLWITHTDPPTIASRAVEVMIWADYQNYGSDLNPNLGKVTIDGADYLVSRNQSDWLFIVFRKVNRSPSGSVAIDHFLNWLIAQGHIQGSDYLADIEFGNELVMGTGITTIRNYSVTASPKANSSQYVPIILKQSR